MIAERGGQYIEGWVFGFDFIDLSQTDVDDAKLRLLARLLEQLPGPALDQTRTIALDLSGTRITDVGVAFLQKCRIYRVDLSETKVTSKCVEYLPIHQMWYLGLSDTDVDDRAVDSLIETHKDSLLVLRLENTKVTDKGFRRLEQSLPTAEIYR